MRRSSFIFFSMLVAAALVRIFMSLGYHPPPVGDCSGAQISGYGTVTDEPVRTDAKQTLVVETGTPTCVAGLTIRMQTKVYPRFVYGDEVVFTGKLSRPFNFKSGDGRAFDYRGYLAKDDIFYEMRSAMVVATNTSLFNASVPTALLWIRRHFVANLNRALGEPQSALAAGLVVGEKSALGKDLINDFRTVGLIHIVVLSGYNITIVGVALRKMLSFLPRAWGIIAGGIAIMLFGVLVGGGATVVRSCFMAGIALFAELIRRDYNVARALAVAALIMLVQNPAILLHDPSFQLSFLATLGLVLFASPIERFLERLRVPEKFGLRGTVASTLATQLSVSPYILYMMGQLSVIGIVVNILVLPFIPATMLAVTLTGGLGFISYQLSVIVGWVAHALLSYELFMVESFAKVPFAAIHTGIVPGWVVVAVYVVLVAVIVIDKWLRIRKAPEVASID